MAKVLLLAPSPELAGGIARWTKHILSYYSSHTCTAISEGIIQTNSAWSYRL